MALETAGLSPELQAYLLVHNNPPPDDVLRDLAAETQQALPAQAEMQIAPEQGAFMTLLTRIVGARFAVEVGTFTGYSALCLARGLPADGRLLCCDTSEEFTAIARRYWRRAGVDDRIELRLAPALDTLRSLAGEPPVDLAFIDAEKQEYVDYWDAIVPYLRLGGVVLVDNVFARGGVVDADDERTKVSAARRFNDHAAADDRVELAVLPIADGLTLARRR